MLAWTMTDIAAFLSILAALIVGFGSVIWQIRAKRRDDRLAAQLSRLDKQLSDLYGPLYAWYEAGHKHRVAFSKVFSPDFSYRNEQYRIWSKQVFMRTNTSMEDVIINNAELFVGERIPEPFLEFCLHVAALKVYMAEWDNQEFKPEDWDRYLAEYPHPGAEMQAYIKASFKVLKERQTKLLSGDKCNVSEEVLEKLIEEEKEITKVYILKEEEEESSSSSQASKLPSADGRASLPPAAPNK